MHLTLLYSVVNVLANTYQYIVICHLKNEAVSSSNTPNLTQHCCGNVSSSNRLTVTLVSTNDM